MTSELARIEPSVLELDERRRWVSLMQPAAELAKAIAGTDFVPASLRNNPGAIAACVLYGDEVGLGPMQALAKIAVIDGRPALSAEAMRSLILSRGHDLWIEEQTISKATIAGKRRDSAQTSRVTWTMDDARRAGLAGKRNWRAYPRQMLAARATAELARLVFADAIGGLAVAEELGEDAETAEAGAREQKAGDGKRRKREDDTTLKSSSRPSARTSPEAEDTLPPLPGEPGYGPVEFPSESAWRKMHVSFREAGIEERAERLGFASELIGREIKSTRELTADELSRVIDALEARSAENASKAPETSATEQSEQDAGDAGARPEPVQDAPEARTPLTLAMFHAQTAAFGLTDDVIANAGRDLYPGRTLHTLNVDELAELLERARSYQQQPLEANKGDEWT